MDELEDEEILDLPEKGKSRKQEYFYLRMLSVGLLCAGTLFRFQHWPYASMLLAAGLVLWTIWNIIYLVSLKSPSFYEVAYGIGRLCLSIGIVIILLQLRNVGLIFFGFAAVNFLAGVIGSFFAKKKQL